jgi:hypothetical protein
MCVEGFNILWLIPVILAEYFEIWIIELNLNGYCLNCSESQSSEPGRPNLYGHQYYQNVLYQNGLLK